jgi:hypothetical protein
MSRSVTRVPGPLGEPRRRDVPATHSLPVARRELGARRRD